MEERESSAASSADFYGTTTPPIAAHSQVSPTKRKAQELSPAPLKKPKRASPSSPSCISSDLRPCARLPPAVWQHVFLSCSLADLGRLIQVNRSFLSYLTDVRNVSPPGAEPGCLRLLKSDSLWAAARHALPTKPPKPLPGFSERHMWQLAWSRRCQFCHRRGSFTPGERIWQKGPGATGVRTIWPFAIRACGPCLLAQCQTDSSLLFSAASALRPALPFVLVTNERHYVTAYTLQSATTPADIEIGKYYYRPHVTALEQELSEALSRGPAAAEEWSKGLAARGTEQMRLAESWERWEVKHQWWEEHHDPKRPSSVTPSLAATPHKEASKSPVRQAPSPVIHAPTPASKSIPLVSNAAANHGDSRRFTSTPPAPNLTSAAPSSRLSQARARTVPPQACTPHPVPTGSTAPSGRNLHDAIEAKANRKTDIEQRCQQMNPPIPPNILRHMDSFKAAIQISHPMNDHAWNVLKPRLLAQLHAAQQAENDHVSRLATKPADRRHQDATSKEAKEVMDRDWEDSQRPIRDRLNTIADDFINRDWDHGHTVTNENSPKFAADLLTHVRSTFYAEHVRPGGALSGKQDSGLATDADTKPRLVLDDMKWVYDNKLKPLIEHFRRDIFLCYGKDCDRNTRFYGFEGVIQHFGARHTTNFSVGHVIVAWREAEWPEEPPFHPDPNSVKHAHHAPTNSTGYGSYFGGYTRAGTSTPHLQPHLPPASPGPLHYGSQYNGPYAPPQGPSSAMPAYGGYTQLSNYSYPYMASPAMINPAIAPPPAMPPPGQYAPGVVPNGVKDVGHSTSSFDEKVSTVIKMTQDIWKRTSGIKDMPNSLRVYVLLHSVSREFLRDFSHEPNLTHFTHALSNREIPKALKNASGLYCKACLRSSDAYSTPERSQTYNVLSLFTHFSSQHPTLQPPGPMQGQQVALLDWKDHMIEIPSERFISGLIHAPGMDDEKLLMVATVFPNAFPFPLPKIGVVNSRERVSLASSGQKEAGDTSHAADNPSDTQETSGPSSLGSAQTDLPVFPKPTEDEHDPSRPALTAQVNEITSTTNQKHPHQDNPTTERRQRHVTEPQYYVGSLQDSTARIVGANNAVRQMPRERVEDRLSHSRGYMEYTTSPRIVNSAPIHDEYSGRRTVFQGRGYGPHQEEFVYMRPHEGIHGREYSPCIRQLLYYEEDEHRPENRPVGEPPSRDTSPCRGHSMADRFLDEFVPGRASARETAQPPLPLQSETMPLAPAQEVEDTPRYTPPSLNVPTESESGNCLRRLAAPPPKALSTASNGSRHEEYRSNGRHIPTHESGAPLRRGGPHRRRDRPHEHRLPSHYYRYMSVARNDPLGRAVSMSRSQSRRYDETRRRIHQQETPQPNANHDYEPAYSRDPSVDQHYPEDSFYQDTRLQQPPGYVSVQDRDRLHASPPRYRYEEHRGTQPFYFEEYDQPHEYEIIRVRGEPRQQRAPYHQHQRYEPEPPYQYVSYEQPAPQRHNSRPTEYYHEERERLPPRRPVPDVETEIYEPPTEIKVESAPVLEGP